MKFYYSVKFWSVLSKSTGAIALSFLLVSLYCGAWMLYTQRAIVEQIKTTRAASSSKDTTPVTVDLKPSVGVVARPMDWSVIAPQAQASTVLIQVAGKPYRRGRQLIAHYYFNPILDRANTVYQRITGESDFDESLDTMRWRAHGAGVYIGDSLIMTAAHVVNEYHIFNVTTAAGKSAIAKPLGVDVQQDIAILELIEDGKDDKTPFAVSAKFADTSKLPAGSPVIAIGTPAGEPFVVTAGIVMSTKQRQTQNIEDDFVEVDAKIRGGSSGGGVFNRNGELIGITSFGNDFGGYAVPINRAKTVLNRFVLRTNIAKR